MREIRDDVRLPQQLAPGALERGSAAGLVACHSVMMLWYVTSSSVYPGGMKSGFLRIALAALGVHRIEEARCVPNSGWKASLMKPLSRRL
jgi:hypothetical protein